MTVVRVQHYNETEQKSNIKMNLQSRLVEFEGIKVNKVPLGLASH